MGILAQIARGDLSECGFLWSAVLFRTLGVQDTIPFMEVGTITEAVQFSSETMQKVNLFESPRMFCDIYCLEPRQMQKLHSHEGNDKIYYVVEGEGSFTIGQEARIQ